MENNGREQWGLKIITTIGKPLCLFKYFSQFSYQKTNSRSQCHPRRASPAPCVHFILVLFSFLNSAPHHRESAPITSLNHPPSYVQRSPRHDPPVKPSNFYSQYRLRTSHHRAPH